MINLIVVAVGGLTLYLVFALLNLLMKSRQTGWRKTAVALSVLELVLWTVFFFWAVEYLFENKSYYSQLFQALLFIAFALLVWFYLKEVVAGAFFKLQHSPKEGRYLKVQQLEGVIKTINTTHLVIETSDGDAVRVPFSKLVTTVFSLDIHQEQVRNFTLVVKADKSMRKDKLTSSIRKTLIESPYCSYKNPVAVNVIDEDDTAYTVEVVLRPLSTSFEDSLEKKLRTVLQS